MERTPVNVRVLTPEEKSSLNRYAPSCKAPSLGTSVVVYDKRAHGLLGACPALDCVVERNASDAHEAGIYLPNTGEVIITSNRLPNDLHALSPDSEPEALVKIFALRKSEQGRWCLDLPCAAEEHDTLTKKQVVMANGGTNIGPEDFIICSQGYSKHGIASALVRLTRKKSGYGFDVKETPIIDHYYGRQFNSLNDVVVSKDGSIWFTDPPYGHEQGFRNAPELPPQVYRFDPVSGAVRVVADGFQRPNGIAFSPDESICYITDTDWIHGDGTTDGSRVSTIYAFDLVTGPTSSDGPTLRSRRVFAMADTGAPDGIKCDIHGNVYSGCGDGLNVWSPGGTLLFKVLIPGGVANFCFCKNGEVILLNETKVWSLQLDEGTKGALLGI